MLTVFIAGIALGFLKGSHLYSAAYRFGVLTKTKLLPNEQLLGQVFNEEVYDGELKYDAITDLTEIRSCPDRNLINLNQFDSAFERIQILRAEQLFFNFKGNSLPVIKITFRYLEKEYRSYAYGNLSQNPSKNKYATLIIPGTGINQTSAIYSADSTNYHFGIIEAIELLKGDVFVLVKPNEDFLANHNGDGKKVNQMALINYHLNRNSSYSASYLLKAMALVKWTKTVYTKTAIAGLSQGGAATLYTAVITQPDIALIASGHSVLFNDVNIGGANQLLAVPGYVDLFQAENLRSELQNSNTNYFFSWGKMEGDYYGIESSDKLTASLIKDLKNVDIAIHNGGHEFPVKEIKEYLIKETN